MNESFGPINLAKAFAVSCNTAFVNLRESLTDADMKKAAALYGFDGTEPLPIQSYGGSYPQPPNHVVAAAAAFGQGQVQASPLQMASLAAAVASGQWRTPFFAGHAGVTHPIPPLVDLADEGRRAKSSPLVRPTSCRFRAWSTARPALPNSAGARTRRPTPGSSAGAAPSRSRSSSRQAVSALP